MDIRTFTFEDKTLQIVVTDDRPSVACSDLERMIGYAPKSLAKRIRNEWADEFIEGQDFAVVPESGTLGKRLRLFESGFDLVCILTKKPIGKRLRRFWADEIAPRLRRRQPVGEAPPLPDPRLVLAEIRLQREERLRRQAEAKWLEKAAKAARGFVSEEAIASVMVTAAETITGRQLPQLRPPIEVMLSPTQIASELGVSVQKIGRVITVLGLRGKDGLSQAIMNTKPGTDKQVVTYLYTRAAIEQIASALNA